MPNLPPRKRKWMLWAAALLLIAAAFTYGFWPKPTAVDIATAARGPLQVIIDEEGETQLRDRFAIYAPIAANVRRIDLQAGDPVAAGQPVAWLMPLRSAVLDPRSRAQAEARIATARASLQAQRDRAAVLRAEAKQAETDLRRTERLHAGGVVADQALEQARVNRDRSRAALSAAVHAVDVARLEIKAAQTELAFSGAQSRNAAPLALTSPVSGRILRVARVSEGPVQPGQELMSVGNPQNLEAIIEVVSDDAVKLRPGMTTLLDQWGGTTPLRGTVRTVEPSAFTKISALGVEEQRVRVTVDFTAPPPPTLGENYRLRARFIIWEGQDILQVPRSAVFPLDSGFGLFVLENGKARLRSVKIGRQSGLQTQILSGLQPGEKVVAYPDPRLQEGARIKPRDSETETGPAADGVG